MAFILRCLVCSMICATPFLAHADVLGSRLYLNYCANCHGDRGQGGQGKGIRGNQNGPSLNTLAAKNGGELPIPQLIAYVDGTAEKRTHDSDMPTWKDEFEDVFVTGPVNPSREAHAWIKSIVGHIETFQVGQ